MLLIGGLAQHCALERNVAGACLVRPRLHELVALAVLVEVGALAVQVVLVAQQATQRYSHH